MMSEAGTVGELFDLAISTERAAEALYLGLQAKFAHHPPVAEFWALFAAEEAGHAGWLERFRENLDSDALSAPTDAGMLAEAREMAAFSVDEALDGIENLEDAHRLVSWLEGSETNVIFEFLITNFASDWKTQSFLTAQLKGHGARIMEEFPPTYDDVATRLATEALE